ncbi:MAG TPA: M20/M25/M40 family metallo-hydrolase [Steroidobacteraceae bacterium]|nr:M20/M25/M40 family metallo-hydrolase [Steroidobacteraceae bacterium]
MKPNDRMAQLRDFVREWVNANFAAQTAFLAELVKVPSDNPPGDCAPHALRAASLLEAMGLAPTQHLVPEPAVRDAGMLSAINLIVREQFGTSGPCIALNAHGDVVPPGSGWTRDPYGAEILADAEHGPVMYGRGVAVSKSDFATYAFAMLCLREYARRHGGLSGTIELELTYDEETGGEIGPGWLLAQGISRPDIAISAGFSYAITTAHNGCLHLEVRVLGKPGHAAMPATGIDALEAATGILSDLYDYRATLATTHSQTQGIDSPTLNVGLIQGGINTNVVPDRVTFRIDRRIIPEENPQAAEEALRARISAAASRYPRVRVEMQRILLALPLVKLPGATALIEALQRHGEHFFGTRIAEHGVPLYTDARHYTTAGIPAVLYGAGPRTLQEANGHGADECLRLEDLRRATQTVTCALAELLANPKS